jgi:hypothetical protein
MSTKKALKPLRVTCDSVDCAKGLHSFLRKQGMTPKAGGKCNACGADLIDWTRVHERRLDNIDFVFESLRHEKWRHFMWHLEIPDRVCDLAKRRPFEALQTSAALSLKRTIQQPLDKQFRDGTQTPREDSADARIFHFAQHATATCCRKCLHYWHGIPLEKHLDTKELNYCLALVMRYVQDRLGRW